MVGVAVTFPVTSLGTRHQPEPVPPMFKRIEAHLSADLFVCYRPAAGMGL